MSKLRHTVKRTYDDDNNGYRHEPTANNRTYDAKRAPAQVPGHGPPRYQDYTRYIYTTYPTKAQIRDLERDPVL